MLAAIFLYAGYTKVRNPLAFAIAVDTYQLLPAWAVLVVAYALPWLELMLGVWLLAGIALRYGATVTTALLTAFFTTMVITRLRGIESDCGCFGFGEPISPLTLARDAVFLGLAFYLAISAWRAPRPHTDASTP